MTTKKDYEQYLNEVGENMTIDELQERYNIGVHRIKNHNLGTYLRINDPIQFNVGYGEFIQ